MEEKAANSRKSRISSKANETPVVQILRPCLILGGMEG